MVRRADERSEPVPSMTGFHHVSFSVTGLAGASLVHPGARLLRSDVARISFPDPDNIQLEVMAVDG